MKRATVVLLVSLTLASSAWAEVALDQASIQAAINAASPGDTIQLASGTGTLAGNVNVNKAVIIQGNSGGTILQVSGTGPRISLTAAGAVLSGVEIVKTDKAGVQNIIYIGAGNVTVEKNIIHGQYVLGDPEVARAMEMTGGLSGLLIDQNTIYGLRQPAYINKSAGTISNNYVYGTRGWVISDGSSMTFTGNTWGAGAAANAVDIAIIVDSPATPSPGFYGDLMAVRAANSNARIDDQRSPAYIKYVDAAAGNDTTGSGGADKPYKTIGKGVTQVAPGGGVVVAAGTYNEAVVVSKQITLCGAGDSTVITAAGGSAISITAGGASASSRLVIKDLKATGSVYGVYTNSTVSYITLQNLSLVANTGRGVELHNSSIVTDLQVIDCNLNDNANAGMRVRGNCEGLVISGGHMDNNVYGLYTCHGADRPTLNNVTITGTTFNNNGGLGIYIEKMSNATLSDIDIIDSGNAALDYPAGLGMYAYAAPAGPISISSARILNCGNGSAVYGRGVSLGGMAVADVSISCSTISGSPTGLLAYWNTSGVAVNNCAIVSNTRGVTNDTASQIDAQNNWWGTTDGSAVAALMSGNVDYTPWLNVAPTCTMPGNVLYLLATEPSLYVKPGEPVILQMNVANLRQMVNGCQALIGYSSTYFPAPGTVAAGGGVWTELIYEAWRGGAGEVDTAIGVNLSGAAGTQDDGTVAVLTLTAGTTDGTTRLVFRPDGENGYATMLSDLSAQPVWPAKIDSMDIVIDGTPPTITCPADVTVSTDAGVCQASNVDLGVPVVDDNLSGIASVVNDAPAVFPKGETTVTWTVTDKAGNMETCQQKVTVNDTEAPVITCPADVMVNADSGKCYATGVALGTPITDDNCAVASVTNDAPTQFPKGVTNVTWTVTDSSGNTATCLQTVTVNDVEPPAIACPANITVNADPGVCEATLQYTEPFDVAPTLCATRTPNCWYVDRYAPAGFTPVVFSGRNCLKHSISTADSFNNRPAGYRSVFYNTQGRKYDVNMTVPGTISVELYIPADWANRARRADIWATVVDSSGAVSGYPIAGFINSDTVDPFKPDPANPRFRVWMDEGSGGWIDLGLPDGFAYDQWYTIEVQITATEYVYTITGASGSLTETTPKTEDVVRISNVMLQAYNFSDATHPGESYDVYWDNVTVGPKGPTVTDNCLVAGVVGVRSDSLALTDPYPLGMTTITWTATDSSGNTATCGQTVTVLDAEPPAVSIDSAQQDTVELLGSGAPNALQGAVVITVSASDNCSLAGPPAVKVTDAASVETVLTASGTGPWTYTYTINAGTANGVATVTAMATDASSNTSTDTDTFNINKNQITGLVQLEGFVGASRSVTFVATGATTKTWVLNVTGFTGHVAEYTLTDVPDGATHLSAKADLSLRRKLALLGGSNNQWTADFVGTEPIPPSTPGTGDYLRGGDLRVDNFVNVLDYSVLKTNWFTANPAADINGDGSVNTLDYGILKANWFVGGDPQ